MICKLAAIKIDFNLRMNLQAGICLAQIKGFLGNGDQKLDLVLSKEAFLKIRQFYSRDRDTQRAEKCVVIELMVALIGTELQAAVQQPLLIVQPIVGPAAILCLLQLFVGRGKLPSIQMKAGQLQGIKAVKILTACKDRIPFTGCTCPLHQRLKGGGTDSGDTGFDSGEGLERANAICQLLLCQPGLEPGLSDCILCTPHSYYIYLNDNKTFIDWENGKSHLTEEPFLDLLEFAKEHADDGQHTWENDAEAVKEGKMIAVNPTVSGGLYNFDYLSRLENTFLGEPAHLGYPRSEGNGIYVRPRLFLLNVRSDNREGAEIFLRYLLSEETQMRLVEFSVDDFPPGVGEVGAEMPNLAVRLSALERSIELGLQKGPNSLVYNLFHDGLTEEQAQWLHFLIENARPGNFYVQEIESIIYEELEPYFQGQRTAEDAARILDNRVQLYLDERK